METCNRGIWQYRRTGMYVMSPKNQRFIWSVDVLSPHIGVSCPNQYSPEVTEIDKTLNYLFTRTFHILKVMFDQV